MARKSAPDSKPPHFLRAWREHRQMTLEAVEEQMAVIEAARAEGERRKRTGSSGGNLSRIERGELPYNEYLLNDLAQIYETDLISLIARDPAIEDPVRHALEQMPPALRHHLADAFRPFIAAVSVAAAEVPRTGRRKR